MRIYKNVPAKAVAFAPRAKDFTTSRPVFKPPEDITSALSPTCFTTSTKLAAVGIPQCSRL